MDLNINNINNFIKYGINIEEYRGIIILLFILVFGFGKNNIKYLFLYIRS